VIRAARAAAVYGVAAIVLTFPLAFSLTTRLGALQGPGDPYLNLWILGWGLRAWTTDPASVLSGRVWDANIFYPAEGTLAYSDHFLLQALALAPVYAVAHNAVLCYNLLLLVSIAASGLAMHAFVRSVTGSTAGAYVAGLVWACWPYRTAHLLHLQLQALYFMPLALLCLHRVVAGRRWRDVVALGCAAALQIASSVYYGVMTAVVLVAGGIVLAVTTGQWRASRLWGRLFVAGTLASLLTIPVLVPYVRSQQSEGFGRSLFQAAGHSASAQSYTQVPPVNLLYGTTGLLAPRAPSPGERDRTHIEHQLFPGFIVIVLSAVGAVMWLRSDLRALALAAATLVMIGVILSLGPEGVRPLYAALHEHAFGFHAIRAPARFAVVAMLGLCVLAALGTRTLAARSRAAVIAVSALLGAEYLNAPLSLAPAPPLRTSVGQWLAAEPTPGAVVHLPLSMDIENTTAMVQSLEHGRPLVNGYSGQRPLFFSALADSLADMPSSTAFAALRDFDIRFVVSPTAIAGAGDAQSPLVERARLPEGVIYQVEWTPTSLAALGDADEAEAPPAGTPVFAAGEAAVYDVYWDGGPMDVPAGTATMTVEQGSRDGPRWTFSLRAETAGWVSTFFVARDRFVTSTDRDFLPVEHRREIREGRREVDRVYRYDRLARTVETSQMTLPLESATARDAISALYYVRTLPLHTGTVFTVPLNEAGTNLRLQVSVGELEEIDYKGAPTQALRLEPRISRRIERRRPLSITLWLSADERRIPLRAIVEAGFGRIRLELSDYRAP
jgi:hypothetical protein